MKSLFIILAAVLSFSELNAQTKVQEELKQTVYKETESYLKADSATWLSVMHQDAKAFRSYSGNGFHITQTGWNNFGPMIVSYMKDMPAASASAKITQSDYIIRVSGDLSWMTYNQQISVPGKESDGPSNTTEIRTLIRDKGKWKITGITTIDSLSYSASSPVVIENNFNNAGYTYLALKKNKEAIEIFKMNVMLFPESWNAYDSLGEAYAAEGNKELAIKNYERSLELNPKNDNGKEVIKKLKGE